MRVQKQNRSAVAPNARAFACAMGAGVSLLALGNPAQATTIIQDNFTTSASTYGTGNTGMAPSPTNLPGGTYGLASYAIAGEARYNGTTQNPANFPGLTLHYLGFSHQGGGASGSFISLGGMNSGTLALSASFGYAPGYNRGGSPVDVTAADSYLGFTSQTTSNSNYAQNNAPSNFTGLIALGNGSLQDYVNGVTNGGPIAFVGTYSPTTLTTLSYNLNTATGAISNVSFGSSTATYSFTTPGTFLGTYTTSALIGGQGAGTQLGAESQFSAFSVSTPEPASLGLLGMGALGLLARRRSLRR